MKTNMAIGHRFVTIGVADFCEKNHHMQQLVHCCVRCHNQVYIVFLDFSLTVKAATLIIISGCGSAISTAKEGKSGFICNLVKS